MFWEVDPKTIDLRKNSAYVIARILDYGRDAEVRWLWRTYPRKLIKSVVKRSRVLKPRTHNLWREYLGLR